MALLSALNIWFVQILMSIFCLLLAWKFFRSLKARKSINGNNRRRLDFLENFTEILSHSFDGHGNMACCISLSSKQSLSLQHVHDALVLLVKRQPMSRAVIATKADGEKYFEIKNVEETIALFDITTTDAKISQWKDLMFKYTSTVHQNSLPWKAVIFKEELNETSHEYSNMIMFGMNHACFDGVSSVKFVKQFLSNMNEIASGVSNVDKDVTSLELLPSAHDLVIQNRFGHSLFRFVVSYCGLRPILEFLLTKLIAYVVKNKPINPYYQKYPPLEPDDIPAEKLQRLNIRTFNEQETKSIIDSCKANGCTVTGAVTAAAHLAFYEFLDEKNKKKTSLETLFPFNNRLFGNPKAPEDYLCFFVYFATYYLKYSKTDTDDFWMMAKESTTQLKEIVKNESFVKEMSLLGVLNPNLLVNIYYNKEAYLKAISNVISSYGVFTFGREQETPMTYTLNDCFILPIDHRNNTVFTHFLYTINGKLTWIVKSDTTLPDEHAQQFSEFCFNTVLAKSCSTEKE